MAEHKKHLTFKGKILIVGFGAVGQGTLPLLLTPHRHAQGERQGHHGRGLGPRDRAGVRRLLHGGAAARPRTISRSSTASSRRETSCSTLPSTSPASHSSSTAASTASCTWTPASSRGPAGTATRRYRPRAAPTTPSASGHWRCAASVPQGPTWSLMHGANPGLVSHLLKQAMLNIARTPAPACRNRDPKSSGRASRCSSASRRCRSPSATARSAAEAQAVGRVRQHLVERGVRGRIAAAGRAGLGHARAALAAARAWSSASAAARPSISTARAAPHACAPGSRTRVRSTAG